MKPLLCAASLVFVLAVGVVQAQSPSRSPEEFEAKLGYQTGTVTGGAILQPLPTACSACSFQVRTARYRPKAGAS
jgi:hypothetical protein